MRRTAQHVSLRLELRFVFRGGGKHRVYRRDRPEPCSLSCRPPRRLSESTPLDDALTLATELDFRTAATQASRPSADPATLGPTWRRGIKESADGYR